LTRTLAQLLDAGGGGPSSAAWLGDSLFRAAARGEVASTTATVSAEGEVELGAATERDPGLAPDPVYALGRTLLDVFHGRVVRLPTDPLLYDIRLAPLLASLHVPKDVLRTGALVGLLRRMLAFLPSGRPDLAECALVWSRLFAASHRAQGRERVRAALSAARRPRPPTVHQVRGWSDADEVRLRAYRRAAHPHLRRIEGVEHREDGVTNLHVEPMHGADRLDLLVSTPFRIRIRLLGVVADVASGVAVLHAAGLHHGAVHPRHVLLADDRWLLDGFVLGDRGPSPGTTGEERSRDELGLDSMLSDVVRGEVVRDWRTSTIRVGLPEPERAPRDDLPPSKTLDRIREIQGRSTDAIGLADALRPVVAKIRGDVVSLMAAEVGRLGPLFVP
jgi:hypothetical protein